jgi:hypothetical protein
MDIFRRMSPNNGAAGRLVLLIGTVKGAFFYHTDADRKEWKLTGPHLAGGEGYSL